MKITKTWWKTEIEITPDEVEEFMFKLPEFLRGEFFKMIKRLFANNFIK